MTLWLALLTARADDTPRRADAATLGPPGCFTATGTIRWDHTAGRWRWGGTADITVRFDQRTWYLDRFEATADAPDPDPARRPSFAPLLIGTTSASGLAYWESRRRWFEWPPPVVTEPMRTWGEVQTSYLDRHGDATSLVQSSSFRGYKRVEADRRVTFLDDRPVAVAMEIREDRPRSCRLIRSGTATLDAAGLPRTEDWTSQWRCPLRRTQQVWAFRFGPWSPCDPAPRGP